MSIDLQSFAFDTLLWTGALIVAVLFLRRPVSRHFGARAAYALWTLPFARLILPPIVLPASIAPEAAPSVPMPIAGYVPTETGGGGLMLQPMVASEPAIDWALLALTAWLTGALVFLVRRYSLYFAMRRELLGASTQVGTRGHVRLIETPATASPVAFGVFDKVIALPLGFMAHTEATRRDLALEHELAHHRAHDLLANALVQPLFALHWFNPLGWVGWRALRRDQEAACDARVVARCQPQLREQYASTIASFATGAVMGGGARHALAAPMACPVLGDKSIIHRLRSLTMAEISTRRRMAARTLMAGALVALPLTASISYAESLTAPEPPAPAEAPAAPAAPDAPVAPGAPEAPEAPLAPPAEPGEGDRQHIMLTSDDGDGDKSRVVRVERTVVKDDQGKPSTRTTYTVDGREATAEERAEIEATLKDARKLSVQSEELRREMRVFRERMAEEGERQRNFKLLRKRFGEDRELKKELLEMQREMGEGSEFQRDIQRAMAEAAAQMSRISFECDGSGELVQERTSADGSTVMMVCQGAAMASARSAMDEARRAIQRDRDLSARERTEAMRALELAMKELRTRD
ncbi:M56 family metallopeptidase [Alteriqipengyuania lutimaris]|uniref:Peptidase M56 domain-containing protein n=1 Tax=Alteriqipengyuania lutimaris TaxID=1538146 RepID=A0A395LG09_9SPHN|nr:M56 family metallopeptidase [Alteriqipengyuania lutimaris]MBB3035119.1 beta-lactamase regulating signal transducer with metallopeptidase domain [Alteriqipengyuania lutimaris]RDS75736.1 hypothetical protein DL238_13615 [Alteriqipengyuania lutimaris]